MSLAKKEYEGLKRQLKKKRGIVDAVKEVLMPLETQLKDQEGVLRAFQYERDQKARELNSLKAELDFYRSQFLQLECIEKEKRLVITTRSTSISSSSLVDYCVYIWLHFLTLFRRIPCFLACRQSLEAAIADVDELEVEVVNGLADNKRQSKLISVLSAQRY
jgi:hypothetical protein